MIVGNFYLRKEMAIESQPKPTAIKKGNECFFNVLVFPLINDQIKLKETINKTPVLKFGWSYTLINGFIRYKDGLEDEVIKRLGLSI